jgi:hypothetical protein
MPQAAVDVTGFLTMMAALSASVQTLVEHLVKKRWSWLDTAKGEAHGKDNRRQTTIHLVSFALGGALAWTTGLEPLALLGVAGSGVVVNSLASGVLVSYGGSLFDEGLGAIRAFKKQQEDLRNTSVDVRGQRDRRQEGVEEKVRKP